MGYQRDLETTVHMRLYSLTKLQGFLYFIIFIVIMFLSITIGILGPSVLVRNNHYATHILPQDRTLYNGFYKVNSDPVMLFQRELWLSAIIHQKHPEVFMSISLTSNISVMCRTYPTSSRREDSNPDAGEVVSIDKYQKKLTLICDSGKACNELQLVHLTSLDCAAYTFKVRFFGLAPQNKVDNSGDGIYEIEADLKASGVQKSSIPAFEVAEIEFVVQTHNTTFSYFEMLSRFVAFLAAFGLLVGFCVSMGIFPWQHWTIEQKWTPLLLFALLFFYNPLHPLVYLLPGWIPRALDSFFQFSFYSFLLFFWLCIFDSLRMTERTCCCFYVPRLILTTLMWLILISFNAWIVHSEFNDPLFNFTQHSAVIKIFLALFGTLAFIYILYFLILLLRSYSDMRLMPYYGTRLTLLLIPVLLMTANFLVVIGLRFSPSGPVFFLRPITAEVTDTPTGAPVTPSGAAFTAFRSALELALDFGLVFGFALLMTIAYSPAESAVAEANFKDDPSVSLAYDSDEDVLYGSDRDDIQLRRSIRSR